MFSSRAADEHQWFLKVQAMKIKNAFACEERQVTPGLRHFVDRNPMKPGELSAVGFIVVRDRQNAGGIVIDRLAYRPDLNVETRHASSDPDNRHCSTVAHHDKAWEIV